MTTPDMIHVARLLALVEAMDAALDAGVADIYKEQPLAQDAIRVAKIAEEGGEAMEAFIGMTGQNPRKGVTHTLDDLLGELGDTALTALYAMQHFLKDADAVWFWLMEKAEYHAERVGLDVKA